jgi:hypothetical protein
MTMRRNARSWRLRRIGLALTAPVALTTTACVTTSPLAQCHGPWTAVNAPAAAPASGVQSRPQPSNKAKGQHGEH